MRKIFLHIGLPKTATSTLQKWAAENRAPLLERGITYPVNPQNPHLDRHYFLYQSMMSGDLSPLEKILEQNTAPNLFLSLEGLSWHLQDFPLASLRKLRDLCRGHQIELIFVTRPPEDWAFAMYRQCIVNKPAPKFLYGTALIFDKFLSEERIEHLLDQESFIDEAVEEYGAEFVHEIPLEKGWERKFTQAMGVPDLSASLAEMPRQNRSLDVEATELARQINALRLPNDLRTACLLSLQSVSGSNVDVLRNAVSNRDVLNHLSAQSLLPVFSKLKPVNTSQGKLLKEILSELA